MSWEESVISVGTEYHLVVLVLFNKSNQISGHKNWSNLFRDNIFSRSEYHKYPSFLESGWERSSIGATLEQFMTKDMWDICLKYISYNLSQAIGI